MAVTTATLASPKDIPAAITTGAAIAANTDGFSITASCACCCSQ